MKMIRTLLMLLIPVLGSSQVLDTTYFTTIDGRLYQTNRVVYENGTYNESRILTDSARVLTITARKIESQAQSLAEYGRNYSRYREFFRKAISQDESIKMQLGYSVIEQMQESYSIPFTDTLATWTFQNNGTQSPANFYLTESGVLRVKIGQDQPRTIIIIGNMLRVANIDGGWQYIYKSHDGRWQDVNNTYQFIRTNYKAKQNTSE